MLTLNNGHKYLIQTVIYSYKSVRLTVHVKVMRARELEVHHKKDLTENLSSICSNNILHFS